MLISKRDILISSSLAVLIAGIAVPAGAQTASRDGIGDLIRRGGEAVGVFTSVAEARDGEKGDDGKAAAATDPRAGDPAFDQARRLMAAIDAVLRDTAEQRSAAGKLPARDDFLVPPIWTETREDREAKIRNLLDSALGIVTDVPVVEVQKKVEGLRGNIRELEEKIVRLKEKQLTAPAEGMLPGIVTDTVASLEDNIKDANARIEGNRAEIAKAKTDIHDALTRAGVELGTNQVDLLLDSVLSGDLVRLVAVFDAAKLIDGQLSKMMAASGDNMNAARKYFAMHAALFAMLVQAQDATIAKIDTGYLPKLDAILKDITAARLKTKKLLRAENRPDQKRALEANLESQRVAEEAARGYRRYLNQQREQIARARSRATHDLRIADNTFETVEASFQLRNLMRDSAASFEAIQKLEAPTFEQIFKNEELRREFESLTRKLDAPTS
ncbi:MAG: hypothetical protein KDJ37_07940 [Hyphomicrobiaceae bacterium]|nr:hypothetical protein [Hyphomicrobiaceae bacterium]